MKTVIRHGTFETNSSSTHSIVIGNADVIDDWMCGKLFYYDDSYSAIDHIPKDEKGKIKHFLTKEEVISVLKAHNRLAENYDYCDIEYEAQYLNIYSFYCWTNEGGLEVEETDFTPETSDKMKIVCAYGYNG